MSAEREAVLQVRAEMLEADKKRKAAENTVRVAQDEYDRTRRRWNDLETRLGARRVRDILAGGQ